MAKDLKSTVFKMMEQDVIKEKKLAAKEENKETSKKIKRKSLIKISLITRKKIVKKKQKK